MQKLLSVLICLITSITAHAQTDINHPVLSISKNPASAGFSADRLTRIDKVLQQYVDSGWMNGAVALIARNGKIIYHKSIGYDDIETKTLLKNDAIFRIASQTKAITSVAVMMLFEEGKLLLDDPISRYIPEFKNPRVLDKYNPADTTYTTIAAKREITIRDLLTHTSGIDYAQIGSKRATAIYAKAGVVAGIGVKNIILADKIKILGGLPLFHQPGESFTYGLNTDVLGYLVEVISGISLDAFFHQRIFDPLGMKDTYFYLPKEKQHRLVTIYSEEKNGKLVKTPEIYKLNGDFFSNYPKSAGTYFSGGGGLSSTIYDYAIFLQMLLNDGEYNGKRILSKSSVRMMTMNQIGDIDRGGNKFGLGFAITTEKGSAQLPLQVGSFEWGGMFSTTYWVDPKEKIVALIYRNVYPTSYARLATLYKSLVYQAIAD